MFRKAGLWISLLLCVVLLLSSCGNSPQKPSEGTDVASPGASDTKSSAPKVDTTPVTLKIYPRVVLNESEFQQYFVEPTKKKYPFITLELLKMSSLDKVVASGEVPDIIFGSQYYFDEFKQLDILQDLSPYIKKYNVDLSVFNPTAMDVIKQAGENGQIYSVPFTLNYGALFYNKDIFDKFGAAYPKDLMSWEELLPLAKKLTRNEGGTQYIGLSPPSVGLLINSMGLPFVPANDKPDLTGPAFQKTFSFLQQMSEIPGQINSKNKITYNRDVFIKDKNLAMFPGWTSDMSVPLEEGMKTGFTNWDLSGNPNFQDRLGYGRSVDFHLSVVSKTSKAKEQAFLVVMESVSKEVQLLASANGNISGLNGKEFQDHFASNLQSYKGKHVQSIFKTKMSTIPPESKYGADARKFINDAVNKVELKQEDVNTALREAQEKTELDIKAKKEAE